MKIQTILRQKITHLLMILFLPVLFITSLLMVREMYLAGNTPLLRPYPTASLSLKIPRLFTTPPMPILLIFTLLMQMTAQPPKRFTVLQVKMLPGILQMVFSPFPVRVHLISPRMKTIVSPFRPLRAATNQVKKIVIKSGITTISENAFNYLPNLKEVVIENGVHTIGKEAFAFCSNLETVTLPDSVINIGDDIVWEGSYWYSGGHVYYATIYASPNSAAITYARKNNIGYACDLSQASVTGVKATYAYTGKALKPVPTITLGKQKLIEGQDYKVTYSNNKKVGTATVTITGQNNYFGTITLDFQITSSSNNKDDKPQTTVVKSFSDSYNVYTVNKNGTSVTLKRSKSKAITTAAIPSSVKANGRTYKVTAIASGAFKNCRKLRQVTIARNISSIGTSAFQGCSALRTVKIGSKVSSIGKKAFYDCKALTSVSIQSKKLTSGTVGKSAFTKAGRNNYKKLKVKVPASKLSAYKKLFKSKGLSAKAKISK